MRVLLGGSEATEAVETGPEPRIEQPPDPGSSQAPGRTRSGAAGGPRRVGGGAAATATGLKSASSDPSPGPSIIEAPESASRGSAQGPGAAS